MDICVVLPERYEIRAAERIGMAMPQPAGFSSVYFGDLRVLLTTPVCCMHASLRQGDSYSLPKAAAACGSPVSILRVLLFWGHKFQNRDLLKT